MTYSELDTLIETITETYQGLAYSHFIIERVNTYKGVFPAAFGIIKKASGTGSPGEIEATLADIWDFDLYFLDQHTADWNSTSVRTIIDAQYGNAKDFMYYLLKEEDLTNNAVTSIRNWGIEPLIQGFTQTTSGVMLTITLETTNTTLEPAC